jgi:tetratricopeptide (TPR) repeat protein
MEEHSNSLFDQAKRAYKSDQYSECIRLCRLILDHNDVDRPKKILAMHLLADALLDLERYTEAIELYTNLIALESSDIALANRGFALMEMQQWDRALTDYLEAARANPNNTIAISFAAECYLKLGKFKEALSFLFQEIKKNTSSGRLYALLGEAHSAIGEWPEAYSAFQRAVDLDPNDAPSRRAMMEIEKSATEE